MSDFDPTTNRIPFGLLSEDEQTTLINWPHEFRVWYEDKWRLCTPAWETETVYRGSPRGAVVTRWTPFSATGATGLAYDSLDEARCVGEESGRMVGIIRLDITDGVPQISLMGIHDYD